MHASCHTKHILTKQAATTNTIQRHLDIRPLEISFAGPPTLTYIGLATIAKVYKNFKVP